MLALVSIFLGTFAVAAFVIWVYRSLFGVQNYEGSNAAKKRSGGSMKLGAKQKTSGKVKARVGKRITNGRDSVPWGW